MLSITGHIVIAIIIAIIVIITRKDSESKVDLFQKWLINYLAITIIIDSINYIIFLSKNPFTDFP